VPPCKARSFSHAITQKKKTFRHLKKLQISRQPDLELAQNVADDGVLEDLLNFGVFHGVGHLHSGFSIQKKDLPFRVRI
jgi:hypothetical protein